MDSAHRTNRLSVLGTVGLTKPDGTEVRSVLAQPKRIALLAYLRLAKSGEPVTRDAILGTFWPEIPEERALNSLRQALHFLRRSLGEEIIERPGDHLLVVPSHALVCDAAEFERFAEVGEHDEALTRYRGSFLDGIPLDGPHALEEWVEGMRRHYRGIAMRTASDAVEQALENDRPVAAATWARWLIELDPLEERGVALLIEAHAREGDRVSAVRTFQEYAERLRRELDLEPSAELTGRVEALRAEGGLPEEPGADEEPGTDEGPGAAEEPGTDEGPGTGLPPELREARGFTRRPTVSLPLAATALTVIAVLVGLGTWSLTSDGPTPPPPLIAAGSDSRPSVAVLPFTNLSGDSASAFFVSGVHESVIVTLSRIGSLDVSGLQAVRGYAGTTLDHGRIADELGVSALMSGSVQRADDRVRIIVELVDPRTGRQIWSEVFDRLIDDVFGVQSEIARSVATSLSAALTPIEERRIARRPTENIEALDAYMRGREAYRDVSLDGMERALGHYEDAVAADSAFAPAWTGMADVLLQRVQFFGYPFAWADSAGILVQHATRLDPDLPEAYKTLGFVHSVFGRESRALEADRRALELRPAYPDALNNAGWAQYALGELAEAEHLITRAFRLEPTIPQLRANVGAIWAALGRVDEAEPWLDDVLASEAGLPTARLWRVVVDLTRADPERALERAGGFARDEVPALPAYARAAYTALLARDYGALADFVGRMEAERSASGAASAGLSDPFLLRRAETLRAVSFLAAGDSVEGGRSARAAVQAVNRAIGGGADGWDPPWELAAAYAALGDGPETLRHLTEAVERGFPHAALMRLDPTFDLVREDPVFTELVRRAETRAEAQRRASLEG